MKNLRGISGDTQLPEEIIHHIQSFLSGKEAARTTIFSKSWYTAWLTRPNLDFSERDFRTPCSPLFEKFTNKTLQRYDELNRKIQSLRLSMDVCESGNFSVAEELIVKALKLGATNLSLSRVYIESNTFWHIILTCPLIEELSLSECKSGRYKMLEFEPGVRDFRKLKVLNLKEVEIGKYFFRDLMSSSSCLKDLALEDCISDVKVQICSNSLESVNITQTSASIFRATFDVPRIRKFKYSGSCVPSFSLETISRKWESDITITINYSLFKFSWFYNLTKFLFELSSSKISLYLSMGTSCCVYDTQYVTWLNRKPPIAVEKLTYATSSLHPAVLDGLFTCCRPRCLSLHGLPLQYVKGKSNSDFKELLCKTLIKIKGSGGKRSRPVLHDLEEVNIEDAPSEEVDYLGGIKMQVCLQLKWGMSL